MVHDLATRQAADVPLEMADQRVFYDLSPDGRLLLTAQIQSGESLARLSCRPFDELASPVWAIDVAREVEGGPLFLAGSERFVLLEWLTERVPGGYRHSIVYVTRDARDGHALTESAVGGHEFAKPVLSADRRMIAARRGSWAVVFRADDFGAGPVASVRKHFTGLAFHPSGRYLAATSNDGTVKFYDTSTWKVAQSFKWGIGRLRSVAFNPDGMLAAAGSDKGKIVVWDVDL